MQLLWISAVRRSLRTWSSNDTVTWLYHMVPYSRPKNTWWRHQMETFSTSLAFVRGIHRSLVNSPHKGQWRRVLMFSLICAWINGWANHRGAGDFRRHRAHYDVIITNRQGNMAYCTIVTRCIMCCVDCLISRFQWQLPFMTHNSRYSHRSGVASYNVVEYLWTRAFSHKATTTEYILLSYKPQRIFTVSSPLGRRTTSTFLCMYTKYARQGNCHYKYTGINLCPFNTDTMY